MKAAGFLIFVVGIVIAISAGAKLPPQSPASSEVAGSSETADEAVTENSSSRFPDTVGVFVFGSVLCVVGLAVWWKVVLEERRVARYSSDGESDTDTNPVTILHQLQQSLNETLRDIDTLDESEIQLRIDTLIDDHVTPLAESRHRVIDRFGMSQGAEILVATAYGERMLNRVWSAAADGYLDESRSSFREAATAFDEAAAMIEPTETAV